MLARCSQCSDENPIAFPAMFCNRVDLCAFCWLKRPYAYCPACLGKLPVDNCWCANCQLEEVAEPNCRHVCQSCIVARASTSSSSEPDDEDWRCCDDDD